MSLVKEKEKKPNKSGKRSEEQRQPVIETTKKRASQKGESWRAVA